VGGNLTLTELETRRVENADEKVWNGLAKGSSGHQGLYAREREY
jgi:hypothetical protein